MPWGDLAEHTNSLVAGIATLATLVGVFASAAWYFFWRIVKRIEIKTDQNGAYLIHIMETCGGREANCLKMFVSQKDFEEWKDGRSGLWEAINHHRHDSEGKVTRL